MIAMRLLSLFTLLALGAFNTHDAQDDYLEGVFAKKSNSVSSPSNDILVDKNAVEESETQELEGDFSLSKFELNQQGYKQVVTDLNKSKNYTTKLYARSGLSPPKFS